MTSQIQHYEEIRQRKASLVESYSRWQHLADQAKAAKKEYEGLRDGLLHFIDEDDESRPLLKGVGEQEANGSSPDAPPPKDDGEFCKLEIDFLESTKANQEALKANGITTMGDLKQRMEKGTNWHTGLAKIGLKGRDAINKAFQDALVRYAHEGANKGNGKEAKTPVKKRSKKKAAKKKASK
jgi:hypothetical protein